MFAGDRSTLAQEKLAYCVVMMADLKSANKRKRLHGRVGLQTKLPCIDRAITSSMLVRNANISQIKFETGLPLLYISSQNHSIRNIHSFIDLRNSMEWRAWGVTTPKFARRPHFYFVYTISLSVLLQPRPRFHQTGDPVQ
jgi:hypothetical protein